MAHLETTDDLDDLLESLPPEIVERVRELGSRADLLEIVLDRPEKRNAADFRLLRELAAAYGELDRDPELRAGVVLAEGAHFTAGLDLADIGPRLGGDGLDFVPEGGEVVEGFVLEL